jgi:hypothetical protein
MVMKFASRFDAMKDTAIVRFLMSFKGVATVTAVMTVLIVVANVQPFFFHCDRVLYERCDNFIIFRNAFYHLIHHQDIYLLYKAEAWDFFKYSPAFALAMAPIAVMPKIVGLLVWDLINVFTLLFAIWKMPYLNEKRKVLILWFIIVELCTSTLNCQSNALIAGFLIFAFNAFEKRQLWLASLLIVGTVYIKLFGIVAFSLLLFYPGKFRFIAYSLGWVVLMAVIPLVVVTPDQLIGLYKSWGHVLTPDYGRSFGLSVMGWLHTWFRLDLPKHVVTLAGAAVFCLPFIRFSKYAQPVFRLHALASVLLWVIIFNHMAESATFVIAIAGVGIWFFSQKRNPLDLALVASAFIFTSLSPTDVFPPYIRHTLVLPYTLKAVPCIFIWMRLIYTMMNNRYAESDGVIAMSGNFLFDRSIRPR